MPPSEADFGRQLDELRREVRELKKELYGDPNIRREGIFERLEALEDALGDLSAAYVRDVVVKRIDELDLKYQLALVYLKGIAAGMGTLFVAVLIAGIIGAIRFLGGG